MDLRNYKLKTETVEVDDHEYRIRELSSVRLVDIQSAYAATNGEAIDSRAAAEVYISLIAACVVDDDGQAYLDNEQGLQTTRDLPWHLVQSLGAECARVNGMLGEKKSD